MKVKFTPSARAQFLSALSYIRKDKPSAALAFRNRAEKILRRLDDFPESGRIIPEFPELPYRAVRRLGIPSIEMARRFGISTAAVSKAIERGESLAADKKN